jgi:hypothetical protein
MTPPRDPVADLVRMLALVRVTFEAMTRAFERGAAAAERLAAVAERFAADEVAVSPGAPDDDRTPPAHARRVAHGEDHAS